MNSGYSDFNTFASFKELSEADECNLFISQWEHQGNFGFGSNCSNLTLANCYHQHTTRMQACILSVNGTTFAIIACHLYHFYYCYYASYILLKI